MKHLLHNVLLKVSLLAFAVTFISTRDVQAQIPAAGGNYTIDTTLANNFVANATSGNFKSFKRAVAALNATTAATIAGSVTFDVTSNATYYEKPCTITYQNTHASHPVITFQTSGTPGVNNPIFMGTGGITSTDMMMRLNGCSYYFFNGIDFKDNPANSTTTLKMEQGFHFEVTSGVGNSFNTIMNCNVTLDKTNSNQTWGYRFRVSSGAVTNNNNKILNCTITNTNEGITLENNSTTAPDVNNEIGNCSVTNFLQIGMNLYTQDNLKVYNNTVSNNGFGVSTLFHRGIFYGYNYTAPSTQTAQIYGNNINNLNTSNTQGVQGITIGSGVYTSNVYNNTISDLTASSTSTSSSNEKKGILISGGNANIYGNTIKNIFSTGTGSSAGYDVAGIGVGGSNGGATGCNVLNIVGNTVSNITTAFTNTTSGTWSQGHVAGILVTPTTSTGTPIVDITPIMNISFNDVSKVSPAGSIRAYGICIKANQTASPVRIYAIPQCKFNYNKIHNITTTATGGVTGMQLFGVGNAATPAQVAYNQIDSLISTATGSSPITGIAIGGPYTQAYNNFIYFLHNNAGTGAVRGIQIAGLGGGSQINGGLHQIYNNTVYLYGSIASASVGGVTTAMYSDALSSGSVDIRNNIFVNNIDMTTSTSTARAYAMLFNSATYTSFNTSSNNNLLWAGATPGTKNVIFFNSSTAYQTLATYQAAVTPRDAAGKTLTVAPSAFFVSASGSANIHLQVGATDAIGQAQVLASPFNWDYDGDPRPAGSPNPAIGADEICAGSPGAAGSITGSASLCQNTSGSYSIPAIGGVLYYNWTVPSGATITSGWGTNSITVDFTAPATSGNITVSGVNGCGAGASSTLAITVTTTPGVPGTITGTATVCAGQNGVAFSVPTVAGATGYVWSLPTGGSIATGANTNSITVDFSPTAISGSVRVSASNGCGTGLASIAYPVTVNPLPQAGTITGTTSVCQGQTGVAYSIPVIAIATGYNWVLPSGASIATGANTNSITVDFSGSAVSGNITVNGSNACGNGPNATLAVVVNAGNPATPGTITGTTPVCQGQSGVVYTVPVIGTATSYTWTLPSGATIVGASTNNSITVNFSASAVAGNITVSGVNGCGTGPGSTFVLAMNNLPVAAGTITGPSPVCRNSSYVYTVPAISLATGYNWVLPSGGSITAGANTNTVTILFSTATSGNITVNGTNACGSGVSSSLPVTINNIPTVTTTPSGSTTTCGGASTSLVGNGATSYAWAPATGLSATTGTPVTATPSTPTTYTVIGSVAGGCSSSTTVVVYAFPPLTGTFLIDNTITGAPNLFPNTSNFNSFASAVAALPCLSGPVTFVVKDDRTFTETQLTIAVPNPNSYPIVFRRSNDGSNKPIFSAITGTGTADYIVRLNGSNYFTFDGIDFRDDAGNTTTALKMEEGFRFAVTGGVASTNNNIINCNITLDKTNTNVTYGIHTIVTSGAVVNSNNKFYNNTIQNANTGIYLENSATGPDLNNEIGTAAGGTSTLNNLTTTGIRVTGQNNIKIFNNNITNISGTSAVTGIAFTANGTGQVYGNTINTLSMTGTSTSGVVGISLSSSTGSDAFKNTITNLNSNGTGNGPEIVGIKIAAGPANVFFNTITNLLHPGSGACYEGSGIAVGAGATPSSNTITQVNIIGNTIDNINVVNSSSCSNCYYYEVGGITITPGGSQNTPAMNISYNNISNIQCNGNNYTSGIRIKANICSQPLTFSNCTFSYNVIHDVFKASGNRDVSGMALRGCPNAKIFNNQVYAIYNSGASGATVWGIENANASSQVYNNLVYDIRDNFGAATVYGLATTVSGTHTVYNNTVYMSATPASASVAPIYIAFYAATQGTNGLDLRNNIFVNNSNMTTSAAGARAYAFQYGTTTYAGLHTSSNNNLLWAGATPGTKNVIFYNSSAAFNTLANYQAAVTPRDAAAKTLTVAPSAFFVSSTGTIDVHLQAGATDAVGQGVLNLGTPYDIDIDGDIRPTGANKTTIGADETCSGGVPAAAGTITGTAVLCQGATGITYTVPTISGAGAYTWSVPSGATITAGHNTNSITVSFIAPATSGNVTVRGTNGCGNGIVATLAVTVNPLPAIPLAKAATAVSSTQFTANWNAAAGATAYFLDVSTSSTFSSFLTGFNNKNVGASTSAVVTPIAIGTIYYYRVRASNACGAGSSSNNISVAISSGVPGCVVAPVGGTSNPSYAIICSGATQTLTASGVIGTSYQWQTSPDNVVWTNISGATNTTYGASLTGAGNKGYYRLIVSSPGCWSSSSTTSVIDVSSPTITVTVTATTDNSITLDWAPVGSGNYTINYSGTSSGSIPNATPPKTVTGLTENGTYSFTITQTGASLGACPASGTISNVKTLCGMPTAVNAIAPGSSLISVSWTGPTANYRVFYRPLFSATSYATKDVTNATSTIITKYGANNISGQTSYEIYVARLDCPNTGNIGQPTGKVYVTTPPTTACAVPVIDSVKSICPVQIEVWVHGSPTNQYQIYLQRLTPTVQAVNSYPITGGYFTINIGSAGQTYLIAAASKCGGTTLSTLALWPGNVQVKPLCNTITNLVLSNPTCKGFDATWNPDQCLSNNASYYQLYIRQVGTIVWNSYPVTFASMPPHPFKRVNWLDKGKTYQAYVKAAYNCNGYVTFGQPSNTETISTLSAGCRVDDEPVTENTPATQQFSGDNSEVLSLYPNPNNGQFAIDISRLNLLQDDVRIEIMNMVGQPIMTHITTVADGHMNEMIKLPDNAAAGNYFVRVTVGDNIYNTKVNISR